MSGPLVVVGDALLDIDVEGTATRLTPDAPVPVLDDPVEHARPGGAGLAAAMAAAAGRDVVLVTALGDDAAGTRVERLLPGVDVRRLRYDGPTAVKQRVRAGGQSLVRLDHGSLPGRIDDDGDGLADLLCGASAVLVSDYGRGVTALPAVREAIAAALPRTPVVWDPHPKGSAPVPGVHVVTPNQAEAAAFAAALDDPVPQGLDGLRAAQDRADRLAAHWCSRAVVVTLGPRGALLSYGGGSPVVMPAPVVRGGDPCGAGDRFAVGVALGLAAGRVTTDAVADAVVAAADYVEAGGPASLGLPDRRSSADVPTARPPADRAAGDGSSAERLASRMRAAGRTVVATGGCFDLLHAGHVATLKAARSLGDCLIVCLNSDESVRRLKGPSRPLVPARDRVRVLEALEFVDAVVVFEESTPVEVLRRLRPDVWAKGGDYAGTEVPETAVLDEWGGQSVVLPYLEGRSTTGLVRTAARAGSPDEREELV